MSVAAPRPRVGLAIALGVGLGLTTTFALLRAGAPPPGALSDPVARFRYRCRADANEEQLAVGERLYRASTEALKGQDLHRADLFLGKCIELSDTPECHSSMAAILYLARDPAAPVHYSRRR